MTTQINSTKLTNQELYELKKYEIVIAKGKNTFVEVGQALLRIRDDRLYREIGTFEDYCQMKWGFNRARGRQLIEHALTITETREALNGQADLDTMVSKMPERQTRELAKAPVEKRAKVLESASKNGVTTAKSIKEAVKETVKPKAPEPVKEYDRTGFEIPNPSPALTTWYRTEEVQTLLTGLIRIKGSVTTAQEKKDVMYGEVNFSTTLADLTSAYQSLKVVIPYAVCPTCQGRVLSPCSTCNGRGMVSEFYWKRKVSDETKKIRERAVCLMVKKGGGKK